MLKCQGGCQQMCDEYYRMPDGKIFCKECWRHGREMADMEAIQRRNQILQVQREKDAFDQKLKEDKIRLEQLDHAIRLEKGKCGTAWYDYEDDYDSDKKPYNYEEVELLRRQYNDLRNQLENRRFNYPDTGYSHSTTPSYFSSAQYISKAQSHYFETVTLPKEQEARRKAEEAAKKAELERQAKIKEAEERKEQLIAKHKAELNPLEEAIIRRAKLTLNERVKVAKETYREDVMFRCLKDSAVTVWKSVGQNPNITERVRTELAKKEKIYSNSKKTTPVIQNQPSPNQNKEEEEGCFVAILKDILVLAIIGAIIFVIRAIFFN